MDDMSQKISQLLNDPEAMQQIMGLAGMVGGKDEAAPPPPPAPNGENTAPPEAPPLSAESMETIMKLMPLLGSIKKEDDTTRLLHCLRPFLSEKRRHKLDEATKMLQIMRLLPALKDF